MDGPGPEFTQRGRDADTAAIEGKGLPCGRKARAITREASTSAPKQGSIRVRLARRVSERCLSVANASRRDVAPSPRTPRCRREAANLTQVYVREIDSATVPVSTTVRSFPERIRQKASKDLSDYSDQTRHASQGDCVDFNTWGSLDRVPFTRSTPSEAGPNVVPGEACHMSAPIVEPRRDHSTPVPGALGTPRCEARRPAQPGVARATSDATIHARLQASMPGKPRFPCRHESISGFIDREGDPT